MQLDSQAPLDTILGTRRVTGFGQCSMQFQ